MADLLTAANLGRLVLGLALLSVGFYVGQESAPQPDPLAPDTVTVERQLVKRDTVTETVPETVVRYDTVREVDTAHVPIPVDMDLRGVIAPRPVNITEDQITLTYFDPSSRQWTQNRYATPQEHWALWPAVEIRTTPRGLQSTASVGLRWRGWTVTGGYMLADEERGWTVGLRWRPVKLTW